MERVSHQLMEQSLTGCISRAEAARSAQPCSLSRELSVILIALSAEPAISWVTGYFLDNPARSCFTHA